MPSDKGLRLGDRSTHFTKNALQFAQSKTFKTKAIFTGMKGMKRMKSGDRRVLSVLNL